MPSINLPLPDDRAPSPGAATAALRAFNRFYTRFAGVLGPGYMGSELSLIEARILYEIATGQPLVSKRIVAALSVDPGYLSRILRRFAQQGWIARTRGADAREHPIRLTAEGEALFSGLDAATAASTSATLAHLSRDEQAGLAERLAWIEARLAGAPLPAPAVRQWQPGDMGLITAQQAVYYRTVYAWGDTLEVLIGEITSRFVRDFQPGREQCWVAERHGELLGSVFLVAESDRVARLRLLYVDAAARGHGLGADFVGRCVAFAREAGYSELVLWTHSVLTSARTIYADHGFEIEKVETHDEFGKPEQSEHWRLVL
jgi:DNA-binding MarR family transcriptional regulator/N-acetylglutamate synthase-like GNAT family acetyltransferase